MCFCVEIGVREKKRKRNDRIEKKPLGLGGGRLVRHLKRRKRGKGPVWGDQKTARALRVPRGVARDSRSGKQERGRLKMPDGGGGFAPGGGLQLAVASPAYSPQAAVVILGRELPGEDPASLPRIHKEIQDLITPMVDTFPLKTLARGLLGISNHMFPDNFLQITPVARQLLVDHVHAILHDAMPPDLRFEMDWANGINWAVFRNHILDAKSNLAALALMKGNVHGMQPPTGGVPTLGGALPPGAQGPGGAPLIHGGGLPGGAIIPSADGGGGLICRPMALPPGTMSGSTAPRGASRWGMCSRL